MKTFFKFSWLAGVVIIALSVSSQAASIALTEAGKEEIEGVKLAKSLTLTLDGKSSTLQPIAAGLRRKKIALFWVKVYVIQFFSSEPDLSKSKWGAISLTLKRDLTAHQVREGFEQSLKKNSVDTESPDLKPLLTAINSLGEQKEGSVLWMSMERKSDGSEIISLESAKGELQSFPVVKGASDKLLSVWWGIPSDSGMEALKTQLTTKKNP